MLDHVAGNAQFPHVGFIVADSERLDTDVLTFPPVLEGPDPITEHHLREIVASLNWVEQCIS